jgi:hypothetical protein
MNLSFKKEGKLHQPLKFWELDDGNIVVIYQGSRGANPDLDFIVKYKSPTNRLRAPSHTHWIVDLIIKSKFAPSELCDFVNEWIYMYDLIQPFKTSEERNSYQILYKDYFVDKYFTLDNLGEFSIEFVSTLIELFIRCEKQTPNAFMFKNLLELISDYCQNKKDFYQVVSYSKRV